MLSRQRIADVSEAAATAAEGATTAGKGRHLDYAGNSGLRYPDRGGARDACARVFDQL
jgi:hypothetical protein